MDNKIMLKDLVGKSDINIMVNVSIKGQKFNGKSAENERMLKNVFTKKDSNKKDWIYIEWQPNDRYILPDDSTCVDCGYSGLKLGESHNLDQLYLVTV